MVSVSYPGVYIREEASGARAIAGVATSIPVFVGMADRGPIDVPTRVFSFADFERTFGATSDGEMAVQVRQFYLNGGGTAWIMRIADGDQPAVITLLADDETTTALTVRARDSGLLGNQIRVEVDYATESPEETFNLNVYRRVVNNGQTSVTGAERFTGLSMRPGASRFAPDVVNGSSQLITVTAGAAVGAAGISLSNRILADLEVDALTELGTLVQADQNSFQLLASNHGPTLVRLSNVDPADTLVTLGDRWTSEARTALNNNAITDQVTISITSNDVPGGGVAGGRLVRIDNPDGAVRILPASTDDVAVALGLGVTAGGIEGSAHGDIRPAANGVVARMGSSVNGFETLRIFAGRDRSTVTPFEVDDGTAGAPYSDPLALGGAVPVYDDGTTRSFDNVRAVLDTIAGVVEARTNNGWTAGRQGLRLALRSRDTAPNAGLGTTFTLINAAATINAAGNVHAYTVGRPGGIAPPGPFQTGSIEGLDGSRPQPPDYTAAYTVLDREVDLFNLMVLPRAAGQSDDDRRSLWGAASAFCARRRAFLIVDPRSDWTDTTSAEQGVDAIRIGVEIRNSACYWPRLRVPDGTRAGRVIDPSGSIAGLMARTDSTRGVWKAPAGLEATIRGVIGLERRMTDQDNGVLNPKALNALRIFAVGAVSWGARTLVGNDDSGNIDDKYIPVRRTMLFIEESLYRGLQFAVFEPNDEPLWAQIRLAAGSFMNGLFRQGAFAGGKATDAYFVRCDSTTTTEADKNLGIVNVVVGFAPLKPAEFVIVTIKQIAGQDGA